jgi:Tripartite tricarboxylate transporter TctB family
MTLRADHVAGAAFIVFGLVVFALSTDLPVGRLSMPGAGFMPKLIAALLIVFGAVLIMRARESAPFAELRWDDLTHAGLVIAVTASAIALYTTLGFLITVAGMLFAFLAVVERKPLVRAALFSVTCSLLTYGLFGTALRAPLPVGPFNF